MNIIYNKKDLNLRLKLSGGYEGGRISAGVLDQEKLAAEGEETVSLSEIKDKFLAMIKVLGFDVE